VVVTDLLLFAVAMIGSVAAAYYAVAHPDVGGLSGLLTHPEVAGKLSLLPDFSNWETAATVFVIPIAVQWWSTWYPGAEPGGGGYAAQRMLAARDERESVRATLWFNVAHYALRPWPWILVGLASLVVYPTLDSIAAAFPNLDPSIIRHDLAYPAMLVFLPHGLLGLVVASLAAAYMSTISTHLNWGSSYLVEDVYRRFFAADRSERHYVLVARLSTVALVALASIVALWLENAKQAFDILLQIGAGTGLIFLLRWFWWRINAWTEISAMVISFLVALWYQANYALEVGGVTVFRYGHRAFGWELPGQGLQLVSGVAITTVVWLIVTYLTPATDRGTLQSFYDRIRPFPAGWRHAVSTEGGAASGGVGAALLAWGLGCITVYSALFGTGMALYGRALPAVAFGAVTVAAAWGLFRTLPKVGFE
jgi:Na+/proline symporter